MMQLEEYIESFVLEMFRIGSDEINYDIIKNLPTGVEEIKKTTSLTKVPIYVHVHDLERCGLVKLEKGTGRVVPGKFTESFVYAVHEMEQAIGGQINTGNYELIARYVLQILPTVK